MSPSEYQAWKRDGTANRKRLSDPRLLTLIRAIHAELKGAYGSPRMVREIRGLGFPASKARIERLMPENGIRARHKRRYKATTDSQHSLPVAPNYWDNAPTESFFNSFKNERVHGTCYETRAEAIADAFDYIEPFYNRRRRHSTLGYASPQDYLANRIKSQHEDELAA